MNTDKTITTATGKVFTILWDGVAIIDGALRIAIIGATMLDLFTVFSNPAETATLTRSWDGIESVYTGYTIFKGIDLKPDGEIVVALNPEE